MFDFMMSHVPSMYSIKVVEDVNCIQPYQLSNKTKELMGYKWVEQFNEWAKRSTEWKPCAYMMGKDTLITHPSVVKAMRDKLIEDAQNKIEFEYRYDIGILKNPYSILNVVV